MMRFIIVLAAFWFGSSVFATSLPNDLMMLGYDGDAWHPYQVQNHRWQKIKAIRNPASVTYQSSSQTFYFKGEDGLLYQWSKQDKAPQKITASVPDAFTQVRAHAEGVLLVELADGKSRDTHILTIDKDNKVRQLINQAAGQFHPLIHGDYLYYAHVSCRLQCKPVVQDIWRQHRASGQAQQLSMLNATSYLHALSSNGTVGFIASNQQGLYHLYRLTIATGETQAITQGRVTDSYPVLSQSNTLYFIRRDQQGTRLLALPNALSATEGDTTLQTIALPKDIQKIRYLELTQELPPQ